jgi:uncharacterized PurR-regulated membrane protein YhhQ (DUF165 family)
MYKERRSFRFSPSESSPLLPGYQPPSPPPPLPPAAAEAPALRELLTAPILISVLNYSLLALSDISFVVVLPIYLASSPLSLTPGAIGVFFGGIGIFSGAFQVLCTAALVERWGAKRVFQVAVCGYFPLWMLLPIAVSVVGADDPGSYSWRMWLLAGIGVVLIPIVSMSFSEYPSP